MLPSAQLGLVGVFHGATGVTSLLGSRLVDRLGARWWVAGNQALTAAGLVAATAVGSLPALLAASVVIGCGYAFVNAGTSVAVTSVSRPEQAATAVVVKTAGIPALLTVMALAGPAGGTGEGGDVVRFYLGALVSPLLVGAPADLTGGYDLPWAVTAAAMALSVASYAVVQRWMPPAVATPRGAQVATAGPQARW